MNALYAAATGMAAQQTSMDAIAHNLANVNTAGFKSTRVAFEDLLYQGVGSRNAARSGASIGMGVAPGATIRSFAQGGLNETSVSTNMAIEGQGYFRVQAGPNVGYTRDGSFQVDQNGQLVNGSGHRLLPALIVPRNADPNSITIGADGKVSANVDGTPAVIGQIQLASFTNPAGLEGQGDNLWLPGANSGAPRLSAPGTGSTGMLVQGHIEGSNVSVMDEMVNMISAQRAFESVSKVISTSDEMLGMANSMKR